MPETKVHETDLLSGAEILIEHGEDPGSIFTPLMHCKENTSVLHGSASTCFISRVNPPLLTEFRASLQQLARLRETGMLCSQCVQTPKFFTICSADGTQVPPNALEYCKALLDLGDAPQDDLEKLLAWARDLEASAACFMYSAQRLTGFPTFRGKLENKKTKLHAQLKALRGTELELELRRELLERALLSRALFPDASGDTDVEAVTFEKSMQTRMLETLMRSSAFVVGPYRSASGGSPDPATLAKMIWFENRDYQQIPLALHVALSERMNVLRQEYATVSKPLTAAEMETYMALAKESALSAKELVEIATNI